MRARRRVWWGNALIMALVFSLVVPRGVKGDVEEAVTYLQNKGANPWVTMALVAAGKNPSVEYLKNTAAGSVIPICLLQIDKR